MIPFNKIYYDMLAGRGRIICRWFECLFPAIFLLPICGCDDSLPTVPATGVVLWNGKPVAHAEVTFLRNDGTGPAAIATCDHEGKFQVRTGAHIGILPGNYKVVVQKSSTVDLKLPDPLPNGMSRPAYLRANNIAGYPLLPQRYMSFSETPLQVQVTAGEENYFELKLEGAPPSVPKSNTQRGSAA